MKTFKCFISLIIVLSLLTGCTKPVTNDYSITIKPYSLTEKEINLISRTGVKNIEFFTLNGNLGKGEDLEFVVEVYENGKLTENVFSTNNPVKKTYKNELISFAVGEKQSNNNQINLLIGSDGSLYTGVHENKMTSYGFQTIISDKITLKKDSPAYLAAWFGTTKNSLTGLSSKNGELPEGLDKIELVYLFKVVLKSK